MTDSEHTIRAEDAPEGSVCAACGEDDHELLKLTVGALSFVICAGCEAGLVAMSLQSLTGQDFEETLREIAEGQEVRITYVHQGHDA